VSTHKNQIYSVNTVILAALGYIFFINKVVSPNFSQVYWIVVLFLYLKY